MAELRVCSIDDVAPGGARRFEVAGLRVAMVRVGDAEWYAIDDRCSHAEASLGEGEVWVDEREIECPRHGSTFDLRTGAALTLPATRPNRVYPVRLAGDDVLVVLEEARS